MKKRIFAGVTALAVVLSAFGGAKDGTTVKADSQDTLAGLNYTYKNSSDMESATDVTLNKSQYGTAKNGYSFTTGSAKLYASIDGSSLRKLEWSKQEDSTTSAKEKYYSDSFAGNTTVREPVMTAGKKNQWSGKPYFEVQISTSGYKDINFSAYVGASKKGPRDYKLSYATGDSTKFTEITGSEAKITLTENKTMKRISGVVPADDQKTVKIRVEIASLIAINGADMSDTTTLDKDKKTNSMKGEAAINHISVTGTKITSSSDTASASNSSTGSSSSAATGSTAASSAKYKVKKITLNKKTLKLKKKKSGTLKVTVKTSPNTKSNIKAAKKKLKWSSSNKKVATVSQSGKVSAKKKGKATITVKYSKKIKATCKVVVK